MVKVKLNGVDISSEDLNILISTTGCTGDINIELSGGSEWIRTDNKNAHIDVYINVTGDEDLAAVYERAQTVDSRYICGH